MHRRSGVGRSGRVRQVEGEKKMISRGPPQRPTNLPNVFGMGHLFMLGVEGKKPYGERMKMLEREKIQD